jgi:NAD+ synthase
LTPLAINAANIRKQLVQFIADFTHSEGFSRLVLGLSGGLDSTVCAYLAVEALGRENCVGVFLPHDVSNPQSMKDAQETAEILDMATRVHDITHLVAPYREAFPEMNEVQLGNVMARCRMIVLYQISSQENALVMGTSNKSEIMLGYGTLHGDLACAIDPLGDLYKTQVRQLAVELGIPEKILSKVPSADLWQGQSDEDELGLTYAEADRFLVRWIDEGRSKDELIAEGFSEAFVNTVMLRVEGQRFKSRLPAIPQLSDLTA